MVSVWNSPSAPTAAGTPRLTPTSTQSPALFGSTAAAAVLITGAMTSSAPKMSLKTFCGLEPPLARGLVICSRPLRSSGAAPIARRSESWCVAVS
jgi:hypothetical protein